MKRKHIIGLVFGVLGISLATFFAVQREQRNLSLVAIERGAIKEAVYGLGTVVSKNVYRLNVGVSVIIRALFVEEGNVVEKGVPLVQLEGGITKAPFRGTITSLPFKAGELALPQNPVLTLVDPDHLYLEVSLEQQGALRILRHQKAYLSFESLRGQKITGQVTSIFPKDGQFLIHIEVEKLPEGILPGMTADVAIEVGSKEDALVVPVNAISAGKILVDRNGKRSRVPVKVGIVDAEKAEIIGDDLQLGDRVVVKAP